MNPHLHEFGTGGIAPRPLLFSAEDAQAAHDAWSFNCGPAALCAVLELTPEQIREHLIDFHGKGYMNPSAMYRTLDGLGVDWRGVRPGWPRFGLARIQWHGPWTGPRVPRKVAYRYTHWVGSALGGHSVFDMNAMGEGGWIPYMEWATELVPLILREGVPRANGHWSITHAIEISGGPA